MRILIWHGYLLGGTGSNVYTRALAREWSTGRARRHRRLPGAASRALRHRERARRRARAAGPATARVRARPLRGARGAVAPGLHASRNASATSRRTRPPSARCCPPTSSSRITCCSAARSRRRAARAMRVKAHGSELEYSMRGRPELERWGAEALAERRRGLRRLRAHPCRARGRRRSRRPGARGAARRRRRRVHARSRGCRRSPALIDGGGRDPRTGRGRAPSRPG